MVAAVSQTGDVGAPAARALALVPGLEQGAAPLAIQRLTGGSVNHVWRVDTHAGRFVLRTDAAASRRPGVDRKREWQLQTLAALAGIAPQVIARTPTGDAQVTQYIDARVWQEGDYADVPQLVRLGELLAQLHNINAPGNLAPFAPHRLAREYAGAGELRAAAAGTAAALGAAAAHQAATHAVALCSAIAQAESRLASRRASLCVVHGDPTAGNVLDNQRLWLIDWEYAQCAEPLFDIAAVLVYYPAARVHRNALLAAANQRAAAQNGGLAAAAVIHSALGWLWQYARGEISTINAGISAPEWAN
jgi:aminoglycoside phosphotransferase (APT) family kinase protein